MTTIYLENERVEVAEPSDIQDLQFQINQLKKDVEIAQATLRRAENAAIRETRSGRSY